MSKFKKGDKVEKDVYKGVIVCEYEGGWLVDFGELGYHLELDGDLRPVQLICDEAREKILEFAEHKKPMMFYVESDKQLSELCDFMEGVCIVPNKQYNRGAKLVSWRYGYQCLNQLDYRVAEDFKKLGFNELNLKTGEVVPFVEIPPPCSNVEYRKRDIDYRIELTALRNQLKEKDAEIQEKNEQLEELHSYLDARDAEIERLQRNLKEVTEAFTFEKERLRERKTEIEQIAVEMKNIRNLANASYQRNKGSMKYSKLSNSPQ